MWRVGDNDDHTQVISLTGHKNTVSQVDFNRAVVDADDLISCSDDRVILWSVQRILDKKSKDGGGITVARDMGDITACRLIRKKRSRFGWISLGVGSKVWLLKLSYKTVSGVRDGFKKLQFQ